MTVTLRVTYIYLTHYCHPQIYPPSNAAHAEFSLTCAQLHHFLRPNTTCAKKDRAAQGQRRLTSYTDPYVGFLVIDDRPFIVRERSPYKESFDVGTLKNQRVFNEFIEQIAIATATAVSMMSARRRHLCSCFVLRFVHNEITSPPLPFFMRS